MQCPITCEQPLCKQNRVVTEGRKVPLGVFRTAKEGGRGWGVRALSSLYAGTFVCTYEGKLKMDSEMVRSACVVEHFPEARTVRPFHKMQRINATYSLQWFEQHAWNKVHTCCEDW